jgi:two-component system NarL family sensor kinase
MDKKVKKITLLLICLLGSLGCRAEKTSFSQLIETFGDNGEYARMDSVYQLAVRHPDYRNDLFLALDIDITYGTYLNAKGDYSQAQTVFSKALKKTEQLKAQSLKPAERHSVTISEGIANYERAFGYWQSNQLDSARNYVQEGITIFEALNDSTYMAESYNLSGAINRKSFMLDKSISSYKQALNITESQHNYPLSAIILSNISVLYNELEEFEKAIQFSRRIFSYPVDTTSIDSRIVHISQLCNHAILLINHNRVQNAFDSLQVASQEIQENMPDGLKLYVYTNYARAFRELGETRQAIQYYQKAMKYKDRTSNEYNKANLDYLYGYMLLHDTDSLTKAHQYLTKAVNFYRENPNRLLVESLFALSEAEMRLNHPAKVYALALEAHEAEKNLQTRSFHNRLSGFEAELKTKEKDLQIVHLKNIQAEQKNAYQTKIYTAVGVLTATVLLIIILVISMRKRRIAFRFKQMELEKQIKEKEMQSQLLVSEMNKKMTDQYLNGLEDSNNRISRELHDGICNELLSMQMSVNQTSTEALTGQIQSIRESLRTLSHQLSTPVFDHISLHQILSIYMDRLKHQENLKIHAYIEEDISKLKISSDKVLNIYRIIQECISNILKHAHAQNAYVTVSIVQENIDIIIEDDGKGFPSNGTYSSHEGLGLRSVKERTSKLQGHYEIESTEGKGTFIHIWFPFGA